MKGIQLIRKRYVLDTAFGTSDVITLLRLNVSRSGGNEIAGLKTHFLLWATVVIDVGVAVSADHSFHRPHIIRRVSSFGQFSQTG